MPHRVVCPNCSAALSVESASLGQTLTCPKCRQPFAARTADDVIDVEFKPADAPPLSARDRPQPIAKINPVKYPSESTQLPAYPASDPNRTKLNVPALLGKGAWAAGSLMVKIVKFSVAAVRKPQPPTVTASAASAIEARSRACPFCGETILAVAKKCKHCGEFLDGRSTAPAMQQTPPPVVHVAVVNQVTSKSASYANAVAAAAAQAESKTGSGCGGCVFLLFTGILALAAAAYVTGQLPIDLERTRKSARPAPPTGKAAPAAEQDAPKESPKPPEPAVKKPAAVDSVPNAIDSEPDNGVKKSEAAASGLLKSAKVLKADGKDEAAKEWLQKVLDRHPDTEAAKEAAALKREW